ncbi:PKS-ER domain-containing protein [Mycena indigotica]|uniref:PKS-ER domain-containing protein n=1 Tax=Mycena indigotica TaxID=2126181 RepID=A0A8H6W8W1_9AGAR|nr:PKS-ER domain-containing protein [Mycena indigotica]KAF7310034.1 PKS-ER domain-containing protein [Mycena indigotica]
MSSMNPQTHIAISAVSKGIVEAIEVATPTPGPGEILLKVAFAAMNPFDAYMVDLGFAVVEYPVILGFSVAGLVVGVGSGVSSLNVGDRATAFSPHIFEQGRKGALQGTTQEYLVLPDHLCGKIPDNLDLADAATIPDNFVTAFYTLFDQLGLPIPQSFPAPSPPPESAVPILVYGAGSTAGQYAVQLLHSAGYTNVAATASSRHHEFLRALGAAHTIDYASESFTAEAAAVTGRADGKFIYVLDSISADGTIAKIAPLIHPSDGKVAILLPIKTGDKVGGSTGGMRAQIPDNDNPFAEGVKIAYAKTFTYREARLLQNEYLKNNLMLKILPSLLSSGIITPTRVHLLDQGTLLDRVNAGLDLMRNNNVNGEKLVVKVASD